MLLRGLIYLLILLWFSPSTWASNPTRDYQVFRYISPDGRIIFSSKPKDASYTQLHKTPYGWVPENELSLASKQRLTLKAEDLSADIRKAAQRHRLPYYLLHAMITVESSYRVHAISPAGAQGLMQLMPATAERFGVEDVFDATENINGGSRYLAYLLSLFNGNLRLALAAYNAGENAVIRHGNRIPPYRETQNYVEKVLKTYQKYRFNSPPY